MLHPFQVYSYHNAMDKYVVILLCLTGVQVYFDSMLTHSVIFTSSSAYIYSVVQTRSFFFRVFIGSMHAAYL